MMANKGGLPPVKIPNNPSQLFAFMFHRRLLSIDGITVIGSLLCFRFTCHLVSWLFFFFWEAAGTGFFQCSSPSPLLSVPRIQRQESAWQEYNWLQNSCFDFLNGLRHLECHWLHLLNVFSLPVEFSQLNCTLGPPGRNYGSLRVTKKCLTSSHIVKAFRGLSSFHPKGCFSAE